MCPGGTLDRREVGVEREGGGDGKGGRRKGGTKQGGGDR